MILRHTALALGMLATTGLALPTSAAERGAWMSDATSACKVFNPQPQPDEAIHWTGPCVDGFAHGPGTLLWTRRGKPAEINKGTWDRGHQMGHAVQLWTGGRYEGEVIDGVPSGRGTMSLNGDTFTGEFRNGKPHGSGTAKLIAPPASTTPKSALPTGLAPKRDDQGIWQGNWKDGCLTGSVVKIAFGVPSTSCP